MTPPEPESPSPQDELSGSLEHGLAAGFGPQSRPPVPGSSILEQIAQRTGELAKVALREEPTDGAERVLRSLSQSDASLPHSAGKYQLHGELARGGMGAVLKGRDTDLNRDVAIKVLHSKHATNRDIVRRFVEEAQIGGQMQHPGIVPVYDLGVSQSRPFFAMKLIKGRTLAALLTERGSPREGRHRLLAIFEQVCQTVAYAHARGVIHRDLKPANVMIGHFGEVQVVDWGMGKVLSAGGIADETRAHQRSQVSVIETVRSRSERPGSHSLAGSVLGTPAYMPPEQANGDVEHMDERSDVFALGAVLCEILTGSPPYVGTSEEQLILAAQADLSGCHERLDACGTDPELIRLARDCMLPVPTTRPRNAEAVAKRMAAYLAATEERAQQAKIHAAEQRVETLAARRSQRLTLALAASVIVMLGLGLGGWSWREQDLRQRRLAADREVESALTTAQEARGEAHQIATSTAWDAALAAARHAMDFATSKDVSSETARRAAELLARVEEEGGRARARELELQREQAALARLEAVPVAPDDAGSDLVMGRVENERRDRAYREIFGEFGLPVLDLDAAEAARRFAELNQPETWAAALDDWVAALAQLRREGSETQHLLTVAKEVDPNPFRCALRELLLTDDDERRRGLLALAESVDDAPPRTVILLAEMLFELDQRERAVELLRDAQAAHPANFLLAWRLCNRVIPMGMNDRLLAEVGLGYARAALALRPSSASAWYMKGHALRSVRRLAEAEAAFHRSLELDPLQDQAYHNLAHILQDQGRQEESLEMHEKAVELGPDRAFGARRCLALALRSRGQAERADELEREFFRINLAAAQARLDADPDEIDWIVELGCRYQEQGDSTRALVWYERALELDPGHEIAQGNRGAALANTGRLEEATQAYRRAYEIDPEDAWTVEWLASTLIQLQRREDAMDLIRHAGPAPTLHRMLAQDLMGRGEMDAAVEEFEKWLRIDPLAVPPRVNLGHCLKVLERFDEAAAVLRMATELDPYSALAWYGLGSVYAAAGEYPLAVASLQNATRLNPSKAEAWWDLGRVLTLVGRYPEAIQAMETGQVLRTPPVAAEWLEEAHQQAARLPILEDLIARRRQPTDAEETARAALVAYFRGQHIRAAEIYREAFDLDDWFSSAGEHRYLAAQAALRAAMGQGPDAVDAKEASAWREQALEWLTTELENLDLIAAEDPERVRQTASSWLRDRDFDSVRGITARSDLTGEEVAAWTELWDAAEELLADLSGPRSP